MERRNFLKRFLGGAAVAATAAVAGPVCAKEGITLETFNLDGTPKQPTRGIPPTFMEPLKEAKAEPLGMKRITVPVLNQEFERFSEEHWTPFEYGVYIPEILGDGNLQDLTKNSERLYIYTCPFTANQIAIPMCEYATAVDWKIENRKRYEHIDKAMRAASMSMWHRLYKDQWQTIIASGLDRNIMVYDGQKPGLNARLVSLIKTVARYNKAHDYTPRIDTLVVGSDAYEKQFGTGTRYDGRERKISNVKIQWCDALDQGGEFYEFFTNTLKGMFPNQREELAIGLDTKEHQKTQGFQCWIPSTHQLTATQYGPESEQGSPGRDTIQFRMRAGTCTVYADRIMFGAF